MLRRINIRNFAIVDSVEIEFESGMTALTGETGAGKSILLDALGLCLGDRADTSSLPSHAERAEIHVAFDLGDAPQAREWLRQQDLEADDECILRRIVQRNGRSQSYINGRPVPLQQLEAIGSRLIDVHGQHAHQSLLRREIQREILDCLGSHHAVLMRVAALHEEHRRLQAAMQHLQGGQERSGERMELLRYQIEELRGLNLDSEELEELNREQRRLASAEATIAACQTVVAMLYEDEQAVQNVLSAAIRQLAGHTDIDPAIAGASELFNDALVQVSEGCEALRHFSADLELDPARLRALEDRLGQIYDLARKHRVRPEELAERLQLLCRELNELETATARLAELARALVKVEEDYRDAAARLSSARQKAAADLEDLVTPLIRELGMPDGALRIRITPIATAPISPHGLDEVRFEVRTGAEQHFGPISKVASGGELSRIGLALEVATARTTRVPTLIFDEADSGIGGAVAEVVGRKLRQLGAHHQVLCVTHLPQVAAQAHQQLRVSKQAVAGRSRTGVEPLNEDDRTQEIARMLGGLEITENTVNHAREMLQRVE